MKKLLKRITTAIRLQLMDPKARRHYLVGDASIWEMKRKFQFQFLLDQGMTPEHNLLDIGCGTLRGGIPMIEYLNKTNYYGCDIRQEALDEGLAELKEEGLTEKEPNLICFNDFDGLKIDTKFDYMYAFAVLFHMPDEVVEKCFHFVSRQLADDGKFLANVNILGDTENTGSWLEFPVMHKSYDFYSNLAEKSGMKVRKIGVLKDLGHLSGKDMDDKQVMLEFTRK